jgi:hypothetical protein
MNLALWRKAVKMGSGSGLCLTIIFGITDSEPSGSTCGRELIFLRDNEYSNAKSIQFIFMQTVSKSIHVFLRI